MQQSIPNNRNFYYFNYDKIKLNAHEFKIQKLVQYPKTEYLRMQRKIEIFRKQKQAEELDTFKFVQISIFVSL